MGAHVFFGGRLSMAQCAGAGEMDKMDTVSNAHRPTCPAFTARSIGMALPEA
ncbi:MAG: hypothetical protein IKD46_08355 [Lentisphaeria bacterium]|nr:hypothetical protein [Lentisphaeria bacterium]